MEKFKIGQTIKFEIKSPDRKHPIVMRGKIKSMKKLFGGLLYIEPGAKSLDGFIIRADTLEKITKR